MNRRNFIFKSSLGIGGTLLSTKLMGQEFLYNLSDTGQKMPLLFLGHGSPMNAVEENKYTKAWAEITNEIPTPKAILILSAHWETRAGTKVFSGTKPKMIYDMSGFPKNLYEVNYPAPGSPEFAELIHKNVTHTKIAPTHEWGLDHGAWSVLVKMFPKAEIPCFQMSLNNTRDLQWHYDLGKQLQFLRNKGVLILSSGNIVHNLRFFADFNSPAPEWAINFDHYVEQMINEQNHSALINYQTYGNDALISVNSAEHYIPLLYVLGAMDKNEKVQYFNQNTGNSLMDLFMRCIKIG